MTTMCAHCGLLWEMLDDVSDMPVAVEHVGVAGMLIQIALRLVERDLRQRSRRRLP